MNKVLEKSDLLYVHRTLNEAWSWAYNCYENAEDGTEEKNKWNAIVESIDQAIDTVKSWDDDGKQDS